MRELGWVFLLAKNRPLDWCSGDTRGQWLMNERDLGLFKTLVQMPRCKNSGSGWGQLPDVKRPSNDKTWGQNSSKWDSKLSPWTLWTSRFLWEDSFGNRSCTGPNTVNGFHVAEISQDALQKMRKSEEGGISLVPPHEAPLLSHPCLWMPR